MKYLSASIKVGVLAILLVAGGYAAFQLVGGRPSGQSDFQLWAKFRDASGLPLGSRVVIAGLPVGEIEDLAIVDGYAKITMRLREDLAVYDNAVAHKKAESLLGNYYIEVSPGLAQSFNARGESHDHGRLKSGDQIVHVIEASSPDQLMRRIEESMPKVDEVLLSVRDLSEDLRAIVNGPVASITTRIDRLVQEEAGTVSSILARADKSLERIEGITADIRRHTAAGGRVDDILGNLDDASAQARDLVVSAKSEVEQTGEKLREKLDLVDDVLDSTGSVMSKIDEDKGTLGRLVNDSTLADNLEDITEDAKGFLGTLFGMQTYVGLRSEYNFRSELMRHYLSVELHTRPDKFYFIELERGPRGNYPDIALEYDPTIGRFRQTVTIEDKVRFTFQFAKRMDWLTVRYGLKESTGGIGLDGQWFDNKLKVSADLFDATFDQLPRLKVAAALELFGFLYILGGVDEMLNAPDSLDIELVNDDVPIQFREFSFGRDYFFGAMLRFRDLDLAALLTVGGAALVGAAD